MFIKSLSLLILVVIFITSTQSQTIQTGFWSRLQEDSCPYVFSNITITQDEFGYQAMKTLQRPVFSNMTIESDNTFTATGYLYYVQPPYGFSGYTSIKGIIYNPFSFQAIYAPALGFNGATYYYSFTSCPSSLFEDEESLISF
ncbi:hypothetical protein ACTFIZ_000450 [Dictyostelium cf. discoideum]